MKIASLISNQMRSLRKYIRRGYKRVSKKGKIYQDYVRFTSRQFLRCLRMDIVDNQRFEIAILLASTPRVWLNSLFNGEIVLHKFVYFDAVGKRQFIFSRKIMCFYGKQKNIALRGMNGVAE